jgi:hypothetical protein
LLVAGALLAVVLFVLYLALLIALSVAFVRATRLARRPPTAGGDRPEGFRYSFYGHIATLIRRTPLHSASPQREVPGRQERSGR